MTISEPAEGDGTGTTYRFVTDASTARRIARAMTRLRVRRPGRWLPAIAGVCVVAGVICSELVNAGTTPRYSGEVEVIGLLWGLVFAALVSAACVGGFLVGGGADRRYAARLFPPGLTLEAELGDAALVVRRPSGAVRVDYATLRGVTVTPDLVRLARRGHPQGEILPRALLPDEAIELLRRRGGTRPVEPGPTPGAHRFVVPEGWASHVARVHTILALGERRFWGRFLVSVLVALALAVTTSPAALLLVPVFLVTAGVVTYVRARGVFAAALPTGSTATTDYEDEQVVSRNALGVRRVPYDDIATVRTRDDLVVLTLRSMPGVWLLPRALVPDERLAALLAATSPR